MMKSTTVVNLFVVCSLITASCGSEPAAEKTQEAALDATADEQVDELLDQAFDGAVLAPKGAKLKVYEAPASTAFPDASMGVQISPDQAGLDASFEYNITNYELAMQTSDAMDRGCANSDKGQHIHFILNNKPYKAKYEASFREALDPGTNILLSFLSRSYHESLKDHGAFVVSKITMPGEATIPDFDVYKDPTMFYSRPKGTYKKSSGDRVLLDFFALNCTVASNSFRVRATIDGEVWILNKWAAYFVEGLQVGEHTVRLELLDKNGELAPGPFNDSGERSFSITEG